jgi:hypothetical protein
MASTTPEPDPMPVFAIKAKDNLAASAVAAYIYLLLEEGLMAQAAEAVAALEEIREWRHGNPDQCKWPDHEHVPAGQPGSGSES